ncbi:MAG TPA: phosphoribosylformylglycinamidine synthase subunit PurL [Oligoflexus sp.]|uniref:phosphoribosylformylglycinamidine synthase subunit PurL n=1 Tax=Oligoflexus sp. TaxID=1971216 RepID=UPI002D6F2C39|nr:phosphoribosylformylglycinamidine synthase subunit PurL [Oligoflexus sp.]HYX31996.1 phosphoribosylformylglycinamidine synthase subunit PurL [Oligoflexus sp.]
MQKELLQQLAQLSKNPRANLIAEEGEAFKPLLKKHKINDSEYKTLRGIVGRAPTLAELGVFSAMWSEHCSYKSSKVHLRKLPIEGKNVVVGPGENAGVVRLSEKLCAAFKMESHNHPSYIEPYQGAATGVGGILRDVFCMGARPVANLNSLRFGERKHPKTHYLFANVVKGIGDYGNCVGIPTVAGSVSFDKTYNGNILVNAMTVGLIHEDRIFKGFASGQHNLVVYVGSATGRDGIHGASMASDSFSSQASGERSTVQVGDPFAEKLVLEATLEVLEKGLVVGLQDMGAAGLTSSSFEMADRAGNGLYMNLDYVPTRAKNMTAYELLLSESQERMLMCVEPSQWPALQECLKKWELAFAVIGVVTDTGRMQIVKNNILEVDVPVAPLADSAPRYERPFNVPKRSYSTDSQLRQKLAGMKAAEVLTKMIEEDGDKERIYRQYDHHIGTKTILGPEEQGAGLLWIRSEWADPKETHLGLAVAAACNERYCAQDPELGAAHAVLKCYRSIAATGAEPLAVTDCLNYGNPEDPEIMGQIVAGIDGIGLACRELDTPVVSGNVSLYNQTDGVSIAPTPMIGMVGNHADVRKGLPAVLRDTATLYLLKPKAMAPVFGGALITKVLGLESTTESIPAVNWQQEKEAAALIRGLMNKNKLSAARDVGAGGVLTTLAKMTLASEKLGLDVLLKTSPAESMATWFGETSGTYILASTSTLDVTALNRTLQHSELVELAKAAPGQNIKFDGHVIERQQLKVSSEASLDI